VTVFISDTSQGPNSSLGISKTYFWTEPHPVFYYTRVNSITHSLSLSLWLNKKESSAILVPGCTNTPSYRLSLSTPALSFLLTGRESLAPPPPPSLNEARTTWTDKKKPKLVPKSSSHSLLLTNPPHSFNHMLVFFYILAPALYLSLINLPPLFFQ